MTTKTQVKTARAKARTLRISPRKLNLVAASIRGLKADKAVAQLTFSKKRIAEEVKKVLMSAIANAENNHGMNSANLYVDQIYANQGPTLKRIRPAAKGSAVRIRKRTSHITVVLKERQ